jgi:hypothetical protein
MAFVEAERSFIARREVVWLGEGYGPRSPVWARLKQRANEGVWIIGRPRIIGPLGLPRERFILLLGSTPSLITTFRHRLSMVLERAWAWPPRDPVLP